MVADGCGNGCGLVFAFIGVIGFGTFGAPLKGEVANSVNPDPFVLQTYKSTMCFLTSFLVLLLGVEYTFTPWGLLSGVLWVTGGICGIFGIRNSGLAISVGTWSAITVLESFAWGILIFGETVVSVWGTLVGLFMMILGFVGMAYFSSPEVIKHNNEQQQHQQGDNDQQQQQEESPSSTASLEEEVCNSDDDTLRQHLLEEYTTKDKERQQQIEHRQQCEVESGHTSPITVDENDPDLDEDNDDSKVSFLGMKCDRRRLGILGAAMDGILGGGNLIPMHYSAYHGKEYIISFATGAMIVTILFWLIRWSYNAYEQKSIKKGWDVLPSMHLRTLILPGVLSGTVWSFGNIGQIMSVTYLGESIGMSIVQSSMIVSGLLGILWFREITGLKSILLWSTSALVTFVGIIFLSHQHKA